jgi:hypothetical protein
MLTGSKRRWIAGATDAGGRVIARGGGRGCAGATGCFDLPVGGFAGAWAPVAGLRRRCG